MSVNWTVVWRFHITADYFQLFKITHVVGCSANYMFCFYTLVTTLLKKSQLLCFAFISGKLICGSYVWLWDICFWTGLSALSSCISLISSVIHLPLSLSLAGDSTDGFRLRIVPLCLSQRKAICLNLPWHNSVCLQDILRTCWKNIKLQDYSTLFTLNSELNKIQF